MIVPLSVWDVINIYAMIVLLSVWDVINIYAMIVRSMMMDGIYVMIVVEVDGVNVMIVNVRRIRRVRIVAYHFVWGVMMLLELFCAISVIGNLL